LASIRPVSTGEFCGTQGSRCMTLAGCVAGKEEKMAKSAVAVVRRMRIGQGEK
jgi:hypothetical protein